MFKLPKTRFHDLVVCTAFIILFLIVYRNVIFYPGLVSGVHLITPPEQILKSLLTYHSSWLPGGLGSCRVPSWTPIFQTLFWLLSSGNQVLAQKLYMSSTLAACFTAYFFLGNHITKSRPARLTGALIYAYNPTVTHHWFTFFLWGYAWLPLMMNYAFNILYARSRRTEERRKDSLLLALFSLLTIEFFSHLLILVPLVILLFLIINVIAGKDSLWDRLSRIKLFILSALIIVATSFTVMYGIFSFFGGGVFLTIPSGTFTIPNINQFYVNYQDFSVINVLRLTGTFDVNFFEENPLGFLLPLLSFSAPLLARKKEEKMKMIGFSVISLLIVLFGMSVTNKWGLFIWLFHSFPPIGVLRGPDKVMLIMNFAYSCLISFSMMRITYAIRKIQAVILIVLRNGKMFSLEAINKPSLATALLLGTLLTACFAYVPIYSIDYASKEVEDWFPQPPSYEATVRWIKNCESEGYSRYLVTPYNGRTVERLSPDYPQGFWASAASYPWSTKYVYFVYDMLSPNNTQWLGSLLAPANVKYVITQLDATELRKTEKWMVEGKPRRVGGYLVGNPRALTAVLDEQKDLKLVENTTSIAIYRNEKFLPHISVFQDSIHIVGDRGTLTFLPVCPGFDICHNLITFAEEHIVSTDLLQRSGVILFNNRDLDDLLLSSLIPNHGIELWEFAETTTTETWTHESIVGWQKSTIDHRRSTLGPEWIPRLTGFQFFAYGGDRGYIETTTNASVDVHFHTNSSGTQEIWLRVLHSSFTNGNLRFVLDGKTLNETIETNVGSFVGFKWIKLASYALSAGEHVMTINNRGGYSALDELVIAPQCEVLSREEDVLRLLAKKRIGLVYDSVEPFFKRKLETVSLRLIDCDSPTNWRIWGCGRGNGTVTVDLTDRKQGVASIKATITSGEGGTHGIIYDLERTWDLTDKEYISFWFKHDTANLHNYNIKIQDADGNWNNYYFKYINADTWMKVMFPLRKPNEISPSPPDLSKIAKVGIDVWTRHPNTTYTFRVDYIHLIDITESKLSASIHVPKRDIYSFALRIPSRIRTTSIKINVENTTLDARHIGSDWYGSDSIFLSEEKYNVSISLPYGADVDKIILFTGSELPDLFSEKENNLEYSVEKISEVEYTVHLRSHSPVFIVLGEAYHPEWHAYEDEKELPHLPAFSFSNGFYVDTTGKHDITLRFGLQRSYIFVTSAVMGILVLSVALILYYTVGEFIRKCKERDRRSSRSG